MLYPEIGCRNINRFLVLGYLVSFFGIVVVAIKTEEVRTIYLEAPLSLRPASAINRQTNKRAGKGKSRFKTYIHALNKIPR